MIYEYKCTECGYTFDDVKSIEERHHSVCPKCSAVADKLFTPTGAQISIFKPYVTSNITGSPIEIRSPNHEKQVLDQHGIGIK